MIQDDFTKDVVHVTDEHETKHTPGEWQAIRVKSASNVWTLQSYDGGYVGLFSGEVQRPALMKDAIKRAEANAKLIAAAPDLLQACIDAVALSDKNVTVFGRSAENQKMYDQVVAAIKKATE